MTVIVGLMAVVCWGVFVVAGALLFIRIEETYEKVDQILKRLIKLENGESNE